MPSLALIGHLIDGVDGGPTGPVSRAAAARAVAWCEYLQGHARRLYASVTDRAQVAAALLAAQLTHGRLPSPFTARDVYPQGGLHGGVCSGHLRLDHVPGARRLKKGEADAAQAQLGDDCLSRSFSCRRSRT